MSWDAFVIYHRNLYIAWRHNGMFSRNALLKILSLIATESVKFERLRFLLGIMVMFARGFSKNFPSRKSKFFAIITGNHLGEAALFKALMIIYRCNAFWLILWVIPLEIAEMMIAICCVILTFNLIWGIFSIQSLLRSQRETEIPGIGT